MGIWSAEVAGVPGWRHSGFWGTLATYLPELDLTVAVTVNQHGGKAAMEELVVGAVETVRSGS
jgi:CubicO group peptidase (beta-lactamase class C family)